MKVSLGFLPETGAALWGSHPGSTTGGYLRDLRGSSCFCGVEGVQSMDSGGGVPGAVGFDDRGGRSRWWDEVVRLS